jgi:hypothetical protein
MTLATVKVFPEPVTPSKVWRARPQTLDQPGDGRLLIAGGLVLRHQGQARAFVRI